MPPAIEHPGPRPELETLRGHLDQVRRELRNFRTGTDTAPDDTTLRTEQLQLTIRGARAGGIHLEPQLRNLIQLLHTMTLPANTAQATDIPDMIRLTNAAQRTAIAASITELVGPEDNPGGSLGDANTGALLETVVKQHETHEKLHKLQEMITAENITKLVQQTSNTFGNPESRQKFFNEGMRVTGLDQTIVGQLTRMATGTQVARKQLPELAQPVSKQNPEAGNYPIQSPNTASMNTVNQLNNNLSRSFTQFFNSDTGRKLMGWMGAANAEEASEMFLNAIKGLLADMVPKKAFARELTKGLGAAVRWDLAVREEAARQVAANTLVLTPEDRSRTETLMQKIGIDSENRMYTLWKECDDKRYLYLSQNKNVGERVKIMDVCDFTGTPPSLQPSPSKKNAWLAGLETRANSVVDVVRKSITDYFSSGASKQITNNETSAQILKTSANPNTDLKFYKVDAAAGAPARYCMKINDGREISFERPDAAGNPTNTENLFAVNDPATNVDPNNVKIKFRATDAGMRLQDIVTHMQITHPTRTKVRFAYDSTQSAQITSA